MAFFTSADQLASLFTPANFLDVEKHGKYSVDGLKPIEAFCSDIAQNMTEWACSGNSIFYKTKEHWYEFRLEDKGEWKGVVFMTRFDIHTWRRLDSWANRSSVQDVVGRKWLATQTARRVELFVAG